MVLFGISALPSREEERALIPKCQGALPLQCDFALEAGLYLGMRH